MDGGTRERERERYIYIYRERERAVCMSAHTDRARGAVETPRGSPRGTGSSGRVEAPSCAVRHGGEQTTRAHVQVAGEASSYAISWDIAHQKIARMTLTVRLDWNWSSFQLAISASPLGVTASANAPSARMCITAALFHAHCI